MLGLTPWALVGFVISFSVVLAWIFFGHVLRRKKKPLLIYVTEIKVGASQYRRLAWVKLGHW